MVWNVVKRVALALLVAGLSLLCLSPFYFQPRTNIFRKFADLSHQIAIALLILQLVKAKNARGISVKTQELRLLVFMTRYLDLFTTYYSLYNSLIKMVYIIATAYIVIMIKYTEPYKTVYNPSQDSFPHWKFTVLPCIILSFFVHLIGSDIVLFSFMEWAWTFSVMLESVAILPQLSVLRKYRLVENLTGKFMFFLGAYRLLYGLNWIVRSRTERFYRHHPLVYICGIIQTLLYVNFYYQYCRISRLSRCCKEQRTADDDDDDEMEGLILESERELQPTRRSAEKSVLSNTDHSIQLLDVSNNNSVVEDDAQRRRPTTESG